MAVIGGCRRSSQAMRAEKLRAVCFDLRSLEGSLGSYAGRPHQNLCPSSVAPPRLGTPDPL